MHKVYIEDISYLLDEKLFEKLLQMATEERQKKVNALSKPLDKCLSLGAYFLLQKALLETNYKYSNISHSGTKAMVVVSDNPVGCDIQKIGHFNKKISEKYFTEDEQKFVGDNINNFYYVWVRKESYSKMMGMGLKMPFDSFSVIKLEKLFEEVKVDDGYMASVCEKML